MFAFIRRLLASGPSAEGTAKLGNPVVRETLNKTHLTAETLVTLSGDNFLRYIEDRISRQLLAKLATGVAMVITLAGAGAFWVLGDLWREAAKKQSQETLKEVLPSELAKTLIFTEPVKMAFNAAISKQEELLRERTKTIVDDALNPKKIEELVRQSLEHTSSATQQIAARYKAVVMDGSVEIDRRETALKTFTMFGQQDEIGKVLEEVICQPMPKELKVIALRLYDVPKENAAVAERIVQSAVQDPNTSGENDLSTAYITCLATFRGNAVPALVAAAQAPQTGKHLPLVAKSLAKIGNTDALQSILSLIEQPGSGERTVGWDALAEFQMAEIHLEKRKEAIERSFKVARLNPAAAPAKNISMDSIARLERALGLTDDLWTSAAYRQLRLAQRELRIPQEAVSTRAVRNVVGPISSNGWEFLVTKFWPTDWLKPSAGGELELILSIWLPSQEGAAEPEGKSKIASLVLTRMLAVPEPFSTWTRRRSIEVALRGCSDEAVKLFFNKFSALVRGKRPLLTAEGAEKSTIVPLLVKAIERDDKMTPRFGQLRQFLIDWKKEKPDWALGADIAASLTTPVAAGESAAYTYLFDCLRPPIQDDTSRWPAAYNALVTLRESDQGMAGRVADEILAFIASIEGVHGGPEAKGEREKLHRHIEQAQVVLDRLARASPRPVLDKVFQTLHRLTPPDGAVEEGPRFSETRYHLISVLAGNGYALVIPNLAKELVVGFDDEDWRNAEASLFSLATLIRKKVPSVSVPPAKLSTLDLGERQRANLEWARWWEDASGAASKQLDDLIELSHSTGDEPDADENDAKPPGD